uniref:Uncharacterized protein n=1 Tax=Nelumbo nucifera TaxID=4432 RepID=A0A822YZI0_NELNU|nr:TPA_asm: hypothetical protein HUJ06_013827 [Nelumbo nucifera]
MWFKQPSTSCVTVAGKGLSAHIADLPDLLHEETLYLVKIAMMWHTQNSKGPRSLRFYINSLPLIPVDLMLDPFASEAVNEMMTVERDHFYFG